METPIKINDPEVERPDMEQEEISVGLETDATRGDVYRSHPKLLFDGIDVLEKSSKRNCELSHLNFIFLAEDNFKWRLSPPLIYSEKSKCFLRTYFPGYPPRSEWLFVCVAPMHMRLASRT